MASENEQRIQRQKYSFLEEKDVQSRKLWQCFYHGILSSKMYKMKMRMGQEKKGFYQKK